MTDSKLSQQPVSTPAAPAANDALSVPPGTTIGDLIAALQDAADECTEDQDHADMLVCASLVELRHHLAELEHDASERAA